MAIPQAMAYALIAGVHPQYGIYTAIFPVIAAALWGSSRYLIAGPTNAISMVLFSSLATVSIGGVVASTMPEEVRMPYIFMIALLAGLIQIVMGLARLGELTNFISHSVMAAFVAGAALLIAAGQLNTVLGLSLPRAEGGFFPQIATTLASLDQTNPWSLGIAAGTVLLTILFRRISRRFPATLAALVVASCLSALLGAAAHGVKMVGPIPSVLPPLSLPQTLDPEVWRALFFPALAVALLGTVESLTIAKQKLVPFLLALIVAGLLFWFLRYTRMGKAIQATSMDRYAAGLVGINPDRAYTISFALASAVAGAAGCALTYYYYLYPNVGATFQLWGFIAVAMGGFGSITGAFLSGLLMGIADTLTGLYVNTAIKYIGVCVVFLVAVSFRPKGIFGK